MYSFGSRSMENLVTCHQDLQALMKAVMALQVMDFTILQGHRSVEEQQELFRKGMTTLDGVNNRSKHNFDPSLAVDIAPYPIDWNDKFRFHVLAGVVHACAKDMGIPVRWGGDWDGDWSQKDHSFIDMPHYELKL